MTRGYWPSAWLLGFAVTFFGSLVVAATSFPHGYDWRYDVMSSLADPEENPTAYHIAAGGMTVSGVFLALVGLCIRASLQSFVPSKWTTVACFFFVLGGILITISALITPGHHSLFGLAKAHAKFAQAGALSFDLGMALTLSALLALPISKKWVRRATVALVILPVTSYLLSRLLLPSLINPDSAKLAIHPVLVGNLAFWEWVGSITVFLYSAIIILALRPPTQKSK